MNYWAHQTQAVDFISDHTINRVGRSLIVMPPGAGKSEVAIGSVLAWLRLSPGHRAIVCVPSTRLLGQFYSRLVRLTREPIAFEQGTRRAPSHSRLVLASQLSLLDRLGRYTPDIMLVIDEAHHSSYDAPSFSRVLSRFNRAIGLSATPWTNGLIHIFKNMYFYPLSKAIADNVVSPVEIVRASGFSYLDNLMTLVFVSTNEEAKARSAKCDNADWIGHSRNMSTNLSILDRWRSGHIKNLFVNRMLLEGYDLPELESVWIDMDIKSHVMCAQIIGRALRYKPGKIARIFALTEDTFHTATETLHMMDRRPNGD